MLESFLVLLVGIGFNIGATILTDYAFKYYRVREVNPVARKLMTRLGRKGNHILNVIFYVILSVWGIFLADGFGLWGLLISAVCTVVLGYDFFHDLKEYNELRKED